MYPAERGFVQGPEEGADDLPNGNGMQVDSWKCSVCGIALSRKQRLRSHWETFHPDQPLPEQVNYLQKHYKQYASDSNYPVPKRTKVRHGQIEVQQCEVADADMHKEVISRSEREGQNVMNHVVCLDPIEQTNEGFAPTTQTRQKEVMSHSDEQRLAILSYISRMKLTATATESFIRLLNVLDCPGVSSLTLADIRGSCNSITPKCHDYCVKCKALFPDDEAVIVCGTEGCGELRFKGTMNQQQRKKRKSYFASLSIEQQLIDILERQGVMESIGAKSCLTMTFNTDGVPLYNSSAVSLWPVFLVINELPPVSRFLKQNIIIWGLWQGHGKPVFHTFFQPFVKEVVKLHNEGFEVQVNGKAHHIRSEVTVGTMDLQAKAYVMEMTQHNGQYGCVSCEEPGEVVPQGKGHTRAYPTRDQPATSRNIMSVLSQAEDALESKKTVKGIRGVSVLFDIDFYDPLQHLVPDYMHGVLLGTTKKLLNLWFSSQHSKQPYYLGHRVHEVDSRLTSMKPTEKITRLPRSIQGDLQHWKASEFQNWLLYFGIPCLQGIMENAYLENFSCLVEGIYLLLCETLNAGELERAQLCLKEFQDTFQALYGLNNCGLNIHNIGCHLVDCVRQHGPLWAWSCFPFEDMNGLLLKSCFGTGDVCRQLLSFFHAEKRLIVQAEHMSDQDLKYFTKDMLVSGRVSKNLKVTRNCKIAGKVRSVEIQDRSIVQQISNHVNMAETSIGEVLRVHVGGETICSMAYSRMEKRIGYTVLFNGKEDREMGLVRHLYYEACSDLCFAEIVCLKNLGLVNNRVGHIVNVEPCTQKKVIPVQDIVEKLLYLQGNLDCVCICRMPNLYGQCG